MLHSFKLGMGKDKRGEEKEEEVRTCPLMMSSIQYRSAAKNQAEWWKSHGIMSLEFSDVALRDISRGFEAERFL